ncbi:MAG: hypothetical protein J5805_03770 [Bacteroidaceae bacterium]|nr:hypothetical protein [Bacteroidaceae bacterium]
MKKQYLFNWLKRSFAINAVLLSVSMMNAQPANRFQASGTKVNPDNTVTFNYFNNKAKNVQVDVQFAGRHDMKRNDEGLWTLTLGPAVPDLYPYCFIVDGVSIQDPQNPDWFPNEGFKNSILDVRGDIPLVHSLQNVPHGSVDYISYYSETIGAYNNAIVYTPPFYDKNPKKKYPVFYLISGTTDTEEVYFKVGKVNNILDNLIAQGLATDMIVVLPYGNPVNLFKGQQKTPQGQGFRDVFGSDLLNDLMPFIEKNYRTINDRNSRAIGGFSRGGNQGLSCGLHNLDKFSWLCSYSSFTTTDIPEVYDNANVTNSKINLFWHGVGTDDFLYGNAKDYMDFLDQKGINTIKEFTSDKFGHTWMNARYFLDKSLRLLFQDKKKQPVQQGVKAPEPKNKEGQRLTPEVMARTFPRGVISPEYNNDGSVTFRFFAPNAQDVELDCQMFGERKKMVNDGQGVWEYTATSVTPDIYPYSFYVDGLQVADPQNMYIFPNERFKSSIVDIRGATPSMQDMQDVPHGKVTYRYYHSNTFDIERPMCVYTPAGYNPSSKEKYPVLYLIHGMTDTYETWSKVGRANMILDNMIAQGLAKKMIVVMPYANPYPEMISQGKAEAPDVMDTKKISDEIVNNIIPFVEANYNTINDADHRAIAGFSLGGRQTLATGLGNPDKFHYVAAYAPAIFGDEIHTNFEDGTYAPIETLKKKNQYMFIGTGSDDFLIKASRDLDSYLTQQGITHTFYNSGGGHTWMNCRDYLEMTVKELFK